MIQKVPSSFTDFREQLRGRCHVQLRRRRTQRLVLRWGSALGVLLIGVTLACIQSGIREWGTRGEEEKAEVEKRILSQLMR